jgi:biotin synthase
LDFFWNLKATVGEQTFHALCLHAGANSIFLGDRLLTADNHGDDADREVLEQLDTALRA